MFNTPFALFSSANSLTCCQLFNTVGSTTWNCIPGTCKIDVVLVAGGGGGGGGRQRDAPCNAGGGGGGAGGVSHRIFQGACIPASACICVGFGGAGGEGWLAPSGTPPVCYAGRGGGITSFAFGVPAYCTVANPGGGGQGSQAITLGGAGGVGCQGTSPCGGRAGSWICGYGPDQGGSAPGFPGGGGGAPALPLNGFQGYYGCYGGDGSSLCGMQMGQGGRGGASVYVTPLNVGEELSAGSVYGAGGGGGGGGCKLSGTPNYNGAAGAQGAVLIISCIIY